MTSLHLAQDADADALLSKDPLALLLGMLLDQQFPMEAAFAGPYKLTQRLGHLDAERIAAMDLDALTAAMRQPPVVHRFPGSMAGRVQAVCAVVAKEYGNDAARVWKEAASGQDLLGRLTALPGFGEQKAKIFVALLGKQLGLKAEGWREAAGAYGEEGSTRSIADVRDRASLLAVRAYKQEAKKAAKAKV
ncbi:MAG TPA: HhH-GPD-type base excision DNA repair protein [Mycobacteriales bacterium]|nr:HhH-GPD-type base excision DNA repair protein [Mycobacteriales bacterium]